MKLQYWRIFVAVCENGSISAAARKLFMTQPAVSRSIMEMEEHYKIRLFERINNRLILTEEGRTVLGYAREMLSHYDQMDAAIKGLSDRHQLRVGLSPTFACSMITDILQKFSLQYPDVEVRICVNQAPLLIEKMTAGEFDVILVHRMQESKSFMIEEIPGDEHLFFARKGNILPDRKVLSFYDLRGKKLCLKIKGHVSRDMLDTLTRERYGTVLTPVFESVDARAVVNYVLNIKNSIGMLPYCELHEELQRGQISIVQVKGFKSVRNFCVVSRKKKSVIGEELFVTLAEEVLEKYRKIMEEQLRQVGYPYQPE